MKLIIAVVIVGILGCTKDIDFEMEHSSPIIVVDGWIESNAFAEVFLTQSFPVISSFDSATIINTFLNYAKVEIIEDGTYSEILTLYKNDQFFPPFVYKTTKMKGREGHSYQLKVVVKGSHLSAKTTIPYAPDIEFSTKKVDEERMNVMAYLNDPSSTKDYYFYRTKRLWKDKVFSGTYNTIFSDDYINGQIKTLSLLRGISENFISFDSNQSDIKLEQNQFLLSDTIFIKFSTIDSVSFSVLNSFYLDLNIQENPFAVNGNGIKTNIIGGIGHFTGLGTKRGVVQKKVNEYDEQPLDYIFQNF